MEKVGVVIIGAGIVGLSVAAELSRHRDSVYLVERHESFGRETSSRNSEVIHAGIYYPKDSLKARTCLEGKRLIYETCERHNIPYKRSGKLIVAADDSEMPDLERLFSNARTNGVEDVELLSKDGIRELEPDIKAEAAIYSKTTGIVDSHSLMNFYASKAKENGTGITYKAEVRAIEKTKGGYEVTIIDADNEEFTFLTETLVNCAGLQSDMIARMAGIDRADYGLKYCKGQYFKLNAKKSKHITTLVYPVPKSASLTLGIHATPNLAGIVRLGPDDRYIDREDIDYDVDEGARGKFYDSCVKFLPFIERDDLSQDTSGIRPKLQGPGEPFRDFVIKEESDLGFPGFVNLIGIESPGLTAAPSIAKIVSSLI
ncbi:NAD(P)/FAD-dependent oxidoreductase [Omnitrophica bacterium]|nr:NAD(P)/FAD-dependent oxidoreductase [Candidatus Omnitrophota bacterium]